MTPPAMLVPTLLLVLPYLVITLPIPSPPSLMLLLILLLLPLLCLLTPLTYYR